MCGPIASLENTTEILLHDSVFPYDVYRFQDRSCQNDKINSRASLRNFWAQCNNKFRALPMDNQKLTTQRFHKV
jgi:hypothetical protein